MFDWDKDNVIVTGSSDGVVRVSVHTWYGNANMSQIASSIVQMWSLDYEKEGALTQKIRRQKSGVCVCV